MIKNTRLSRTFGLVAGILVLIVFCTNAIFAYRIKGSIVYDNSHYVLLAIAILLLFTYRFTIGIYIQLLSIFINTLVNFYFTPRFAFGFMQLFLLILLLKKYGLLEHNLLIKVVVSAILFLGFYSYSMIKKDVGIEEIIVTIIFFISFFICFIIIQFDEIKEYMENEKAYKKTIKKLESELSDISRYVDPIEAGLTKTEMILLESLCIFRESNAELASRLSKSENTVKAQIRKILDKIGADNRYHLIELCRNYFILKENT